MIATVGYATPFQLVARQVTLKPKGRKLTELGPKVDVAAVHAGPGVDEAGLEAIINGAGLSRTGKDSPLKHNLDPAAMWEGPCSPEFHFEFALARAVPLAAIEVWNFNSDWQTLDGIRKADVAVSTDGTTWQTVLTAAEFAEAEGTVNYDQPVVLKLNGVTAKLVRFQNIVPWGKSGKVGLSEVVFHQAGEAR